jgi:hypothetical protein
VGFFPALAVSPWNEHVVYFASHFLYQSTDGALTWTQISTQDLTGGCSDGSCTGSDFAFSYAYGDYYEVCTLSQTSQFAGARAWCFPGQYPDQLGVFLRYRKTAFQLKFPRTRK